MSAAASASNPPAATVTADACANATCAAGTCAVAGVCADADKSACADSGAAASNEAVTLPKLDVHVVRMKAKESRTTDNEGDMETARRFVKALKSMLGDAAVVAHGNLRNDEDEDAPWYAYADALNRTDDALVTRFDTLTPEEVRHIANYVSTGRKSSFIRGSVFAALVQANALRPLQHLLRRCGMEVQDLPQCRGMNELLLAVQSHSNETAAFLMESRVGRFDPTMLHEVKESSAEFSDALRTAVLADNTELALRVLPQFTVAMLTNPKRYGRLASGVPCKSAALSAVIRNNVTLIKAFEERGVDFSQVTDSSGETAVQWAAFYGSNAALIHLVRKYNIDVNAPQGPSERRLAGELLVGGKNENPNKPSTLAALVFLKADLMLSAYGQSTFGHGQTLLGELLQGDEWLPLATVALSMRADWLDVPQTDVFCDRMLPHITLRQALRQRDRRFETLLEEQREQNHAVRENMARLARE